MEIEIYHDKTQATIATRGGWLTNLSDEKGDLLFPMRTFTLSDGQEKLRGGCHVCLPNFGPGGSSAQPQHGYGREAEWVVREKTGNSVSLVCAGGGQGYEHLAAVLSYRLGGQALMMSLEVTNDGSEDLRVAPGFHPYFATKALPVTLNSEPLDTRHLGEAVFFEGSEWTLKAAGRVFSLKSQELGVWAKWTDDLGPYVCVEPTLAGFAFERDVLLSEEILRPRQGKSYSFSMHWS